MEDSLVPETPAANHQKAQQTIIPGTPDSSFDNSSTVGNVSVIPATQGKEEKSVFRHPTLPPKTATNSTQKNGIQNTSIDAQDNLQNFDVEEKQNVGGSRISIYDMETQNFSFNFHDETDVDIEDIDTQKICISRSIKNLTKSVQEQKVDMHDIQAQAEAPEEVTDIHDIETQYDINIQDMKISKKINTHNLKTRDSDKLEATRIEKEGNLTNEVRSNVNNTVVQKDKGNESTSNPNNTDEGENQNKKLPGIEKGLQNRLEEIETSEDETSELEMSRNLLGPKELEDFIEDDDLSDEVKSKSPTLIKTSCVNNNCDVNNKSTDNENIFEAATQVNKSDEDAFRSLSERKYTFQASLVADDSDHTDNEAVFQRYSHKDSQESKKSLNNRVSDSEDSITDEEGRFTEIAVKMKQAVEFSQLNRSKEIKNSANSSKDSDDLFDMLTQPVNRKDEDSSPKSNEKPKDNKYESEVDSNSPTQVINKKEMKNNMEINDVIQTKELNDITPTQVLSTNKSSLREASCTISTGNNKKSDKEDITEIEDNTPTQIINTKKKPLDVSNNEPPCSLDPLVLNVTDRCNIEDIDYEMACTQPINDIEKQKSVSSISGKRKNESNFEALARVNLDDSVERNLKAMFADIKEERIEEQLEISTQVLEHVLESSDCENISPTQNHKSNVDSNSLTDKKAMKLSISNSIPTSSSTPKSIPKNPLTSKSVSTDSSTLKSTIKDSSTSISLREKKSKISNIAKMIQEETDISKNGTSKLNKYSKNIDDQASSTSIDCEQIQQTSKALQSDDEDILAGLPEVNISGTLSNPESPTSTTSSEYRININHNWGRQTSVKIAPRKKEALRKSSRRTSTRRNMEKAVSYHTISEPNSSNISETSSNSYTNNFDINKIPVCKHDEKGTSRKSKRLIKKTKNLCKSKESDSFVELKSVTSIHSQEKARQSPPISNNRRTRNSSKENIDRSSVFQVEKEVPVEIAPAELTKKNVSNASRVRKRSLSTTDAIDSNTSKKRKNEVNEDKPVSNKSRKKNTIDDEGNSANVDKKNSSNSINGSNNRRISNEASLDKQAIVRVQRMSLSTPTESISSTPTELVNESDNNCKIRQNRLTNVICDIQTSDSRIVSSISSNENYRTTKNVETRKNPKRKTTKKTELVADDISSQIGEESQEIEMIMNSALKKQNTGSNIERKEDTERNTSTKAKNTRKRGNTDINTDVDNTEISSTSSILSESDNTHFEVPTLRSKRAKVSKNISSIISTTVNESTKRNDKLSIRSTRSQQSIVDSSLEESAEMIANQTTSNNSANKRNNFRKKQQKQTTGKTKNKRQKEDFVEETSISETNSSIETTSVLSTPNRTRRSMSSSFAAQSPFKIKHKILFTGISSNDYNKLLTKLGASQVEDPTKCTVLVTDKVRRTVKFLCALALPVPIVSVDWLINSGKAGRFIELENYILKDLVAEAKFRFKLGKSLEKAKEHKLLKGYTLVLTPNTAPPPLELKNIIISCGGKALLRPPPKLWPQQSVIISPKEDLTDAKKFLAKAPKTVTVQSTEFILTGILRQELEFNEFKLI
ncbi:mediator of DNA damage checkpoint protein 1 isoform X3 [Bombus huntii]|nr:mediator of DNA damage checkpoint protein 1 isoform X3 [Bombus huntii]XP_050471673.1 mediator of DNA damage checkpoint protein 1 isoform X3 [Bombus huntii]XP_050471674.1 mediator of DNA damage checkpoint protein 1 isoform X3 [Bombus huntii]XP_050471675.1 mediator of DNA damage checkpoint protein 1 isoform X3 [Bombus huntii]